MKNESSELADALVAMWERSHRVNLLLLSHLEDAWMDLRYAARVRTIGKTFSHIHQVRLMWLGAAMGSEVPDRIRIKEGYTAELLHGHLLESAEAISSMIRKVIEKGKVPGFKGSPADFVGYLVAHEAHHRGQILVALRVNGKKLAQEQVFGLWEWGEI